MYRNSFTVDNGPERRLDDPNNAEFLKDLARGIVPKELMDGDGSGGGGGGGGGDATVGLIDKRHADYNADDCDCDDDHGHGQGPAVPRSFAGEGQSLGSTAAVATGGIISPTTTTAETPTVNTAQPTTVIQIRLLNGRRLRVTINKCSTVLTLVEFINASGDAGGEDYVLTAGFPPKVLGDLSLTVEECGLAGSQVIQKKA